MKNANIVLILNKFGILVSITVQFDTNMNKFTASNLKALQFCSIILISHKFGNLN